MVMRDFIYFITTEKHHSNHFLATTMLTGNTELKYILRQKRQTFYTTKFGLNRCSVFYGVTKTFSVSTGKPCSYNINKYKPSFQPLTSTVALACPGAILAL